MFLLLFVIFNFACDCSKNFSQRTCFKSPVSGHRVIFLTRGVGTGGGGGLGPPTLKITQKVPFSIEVKCPFSLWKRFLNEP